MTDLIPAPKGDLGPALLDALDRIAEQVIEAGLVPDSFTKGGGPVTEAAVKSRVKIALLKGHEVGLQPLQALQWIAIINGRPSIWGDALPGLVNASGKCEWVKEFWEGEPGTDERTAVCMSKRVDQSEPYTRKFSVAQAKRAKLWGKPGPWMSYPDRMMMMRARAFCFRDAYADALGGLLVAEEVEDYPMKDISPADVSFLDDEAKGTVGVTTEHVPHRTVILDDGTKGTAGLSVEHATDEEFTGGESETGEESPAPEPSPVAVPSGPSPDPDDWKTRTAETEAMIDALESAEIAEHFENLLEQRLLPYRNAGRNLDVLRLMKRYSDKMASLQAGDSTSKPQ